MTPDYRPCRKVSIGISTYFSRFFGVHLVCVVTTAAPLYQRSVVCLDAMTGGLPNSCWLRSNCHHRIKSRKVHDHGKNGVAFIGDMV
jgi:hypothetical protein